MTRLNETANTDEVTVRYGLAGNVYAYSLHREPVVELCRRIGKSPNSVYHNKNHGVWAIRIKSTQHIARLQFVGRVREFGWDIDRA